MKTVDYIIGPGADLRGANLVNRDLRGVNLFGADLTCADLTGADLTGADLRLAKIKGAKTKGAKLINCRLPHEIIFNSEGDSNVWQHFIEQYPQGCHVWCGATNNNHNTTDGMSYDYGVFRLIDCHTQLVHRQAFFLATGEELSQDIDVTPVGKYGCENRLCVNPEHLYVGPQGGEKIRMSELI